VQLRCRRRGVGALLVGAPEERALAQRYPPVLLGAAASAAAQRALDAGSTIVARPGGHRRAPANAEATADRLGSGPGRSAGWRHASASRRGPGGGAEGRATARRAERVDELGRRRRGLERAFRVGARRDRVLGRHVHVVRPRRCGGPKPGSPSPRPRERNSRSPSSTLAPPLRRSPAAIAPLACAAFLRTSNRISARRTVQCAAVRIRPSPDCADARCNEQYRLAHAGVWKSGWSGALFSFSGRSEPFTLLCEKERQRAAVVESAVLLPSADPTAMSAHEERPASPSDARTVASDYMHHFLLPLLVKFASTKTTQMYSPQPNQPLTQPPRPATLPTTSAVEVLVGCLCIVAMFVPAWLGSSIGVPSRRRSPPALPVDRTAALAVR
jgi:hypothetical protein